MTTPKAITFIVVGTLSFLSIIYFASLSYCVIMGISPPDTIMRSMEAAGIYALGALSGVLVNTRTQQPTEKEK
jgi:hypothetical protein